MSNAAGSLSFEVLESTIDPTEECTVRTHNEAGTVFIHGLDLINFLQRLALNVGVTAFKMKEIDASDTDIQILEGNIHTLNAVSQQLGELVFRD